MSKKLYEYQLNKVNPFLEDTVSHVEKGDKMIFFGDKKGDMMIGQDGTVKGHNIFAKRTEVDRAQFTKIFTSHLSSWFQMSKTGLRIFAFIANNLKPNSDFFIFSYEDCMEYTGYKTKKSIADGIKELIENNFIARGANSYMYYINPTIFFNGNRISFLEQYEIKEAIEAKKEEQLKIEIKND